ncbi:MAG: hypothetical protein U5N85_13365 [Arcicella sp.]|nr:hypothetical protein [Arcicella sp.]
MGKQVSMTGMLFGYDLAGFSPVVAAVSGTGVDAQKFSTLPSFAAQLGFENKTFLASVGVEGNTLRPRTSDFQNPSTGVFGAAGVQKNITTNIFGLNLLAYAKYTGSKITVKAHTTYGQSFTQYVGFGGFAEYRDATTGAWKYVAHNQINMWGELISTASKKFQPALFVGYSQNLGLSTAINRSSITGTSLAFVGRGVGTGRTMDNLLRIAPRLDIYSGKMKFALEYELSTIG